MAGDVLEGHDVNQQLISRATKLASRDLRTSGTLNQIPSRIIILRTRRVCAECPLLNVGLLVHLERSPRVVQSVVNPIP